ncbi:MAG: sel1 repeat family protein [Gammaproteobacteria bacterium]|nr:sel1 repeat family protein [Gammaproteobacteria bacterium]
MRNILMWATTLICATGLTVIAPADAAESSTTQDGRWILCRTVPAKSAMPHHVGREYKKFHGEWSRQLDACQALQKEDFKDPDLHFYMGRLLNKLNKVDEAIEQFQLARAKGSTKGITALAFLMWSNEIPTKKIGVSQRALYEEAAQRGDPVAQIKLADLLMSNIMGMKNDPDDSPYPLAESQKQKYQQQIIKLLQQASAQGNVIADYELGYQYSLLQIEHPKDDAIKKLAEHHLDKAAKGGVRDATIELRRLYHRDIAQYGDPEKMPYQTTFIDALSRP